MSGPFKHRNPAGLFTKRNEFSLTNNAKYDKGLFVTKKQDLYISVTKMKFYMNLKALFFTSRLKLNCVTPQ
jgi:hypothetical protein